MDDLEFVQRLHPDQITPAGFSLSGLQIRFDRPFMRNPSVSVHVGRSVNTGELSVHWQAHGLPASATGGELQLATYEGSIPDNPHGWWQS